MSGPGHNTAAGGVDATRLRNIVERVERLVEERKALTSDIRDLMAEAKSGGFDLKALRAALKVRASDREEFEAVEMQRDLYLAALSS